MGGLLGVVEEERRGEGVRWRDRRGIVVVVGLGRERRDRVRRKEDREGIEAMVCVSEFLIPLIRVEEEER